MKLRLASILSVAFAIPLTACGGGDGDGDFSIDPNGTDTGFVASEIIVPTSSGQATSTYGLDLDDDGMKDNSLGGSLGLLASQGIDLNGSLADSVNTGSVVILANLKATALDNASGVGISFLLGENPSTAPCTDEADPTTCGKHLDGATSFDVSAGSPQNALIGGQLIGGTFETVQEGSIRLELELVAGSPKIVINLISARAAFTVGGGGTTLTGGVLGGAITSAEADANILPVVVTLVQDTIADDCMGASPDCCTEGSTGKTLLDLFDNADDDCMVTEQQIRENSIVSSILAPDLDLEGDDGVDDAISLGLGFSGVGATFTP